MNSRQPTRFQKKTRRLIDSCYEILQRLHPISLRGLHYQLVSTGFYANDRSSYQRLSKVMTNAREQRLIPWNWIVDNLRQTHKPSSWSGLADFGETVRDAYRKDFWSHMPAHVEIFVEKDAMAAALQPATRSYDSVACGVLPPGLVHKPLAAMASIICFVVIGSPALASSLAAASMALSLPSRLGLAVFALAGFLAAAVLARLVDFVLAVLVADMVILLVQAIDGLAAIFRRREPPTATRPARRVSA